MIKVQSVKSIGLVAKAVRKQQRLDQKTVSLLSGNGVNFASSVENGKPSCEIARVLNLLHSLGIQVQLDLPDGVDESAIKAMLNKVDG
ncbi:hypothetical protein [Catenovulum agarivorans]|uniref:hypothetical protein n=1 Tax=Catenovulum agarivorans TaxID=1172192 RepID=UPI0002D34A21|nr:hypothetical protein [Catenovulum agarivorans]